MRVLLVEDSAADRELIEIMLTQTGLPANVMSCVTLQAARQRLGQPSYDVILLDLTLPDARGCEAVHALVSLVPDVPLIVLTELDDRRTAVQAMQGGAQEYIIKSDLSPDVLGGLIRHAIQRKHRENVEHRLHTADRMVAMGQLAAGIAHELAHPLHLLSSSTEVAVRHLGGIERAIEELRSRADRRGLDIGSQRVVRDMQALSAHLEEGLTGLEHLQDLVEQLKTLTRQDQRAAVEPVNVNDVLEVACSVTSAQLRNRARLITDYSELPPLPADSGRLLQVFNNVLLNASDAFETNDLDDNEVVVTTRCDDGTIVVETRDNGVGMPEHVRARVFEIFYTTKPREVGTGLGLPIAKEIVQDHRGTLDIDSTPGQGTRVTIRLPLDNGLQPEVQPRPKPRSGLAPNLRVLVVDDDEIVGRALARLLAPLHVEVTLAADEALARLDQDPSFDVIVCDLMMPVLDGVEFHARVEQLDPRLAERILFCSGGALTPKTREFVDRHHERILAKPMRRAELIDAIAALVTTARPAA